MAAMLQVQVALVVRRPARTARNSAAAITFRHAQTALGQMPRRLVPTAAKTAHASRIQVHARMARNSATAIFFRSARINSGQTPKPVPTAAKMAHANQAAPWTGAITMIVRVRMVHNVSLSIARITQFAAQIVYIA